MEQGDAASNLTWILTLSGILIPTLGAVIGTYVSRESRSPRPIRNLAQLADARGKLPADSEAGESLDGLIQKYVAAIQPDLIRVRVLNQGALLGLLFLAIVTIGAMYLLAQWIIVSQGTGWNFVAWLVTFVAGLFLLLLNVVAVQSLFNPSKEEKKKEDDERAAATVKEEAGGQAPQA